MTARLDPPHDAFFAVAESMTLAGCGDVSEARDSSAFDSIETTEGPARFDATVLRAEAVTIGGDKPSPVSGAPGTNVR